VKENPNNRFFFLLLEELLDHLVRFFSDLKDIGIHSFSTPLRLVL